MIDNGSRISSEPHVMNATTRRSNPLDKMSQNKIIENLGRESKIKIKRIKATAALPAVLIIGGIIMEIGVAGLFITFYIGEGTFGAKFSAEALSAAESGVEDAVIRVVRNKSFSSTSPYTVNVGSRSAQITVCKEFRSVTLACDTAYPGKYEITSLGTALNKKRQIRAILNLNSVTGQIQVESIEEIPL